MDIDRSAALTLQAQSTTNGIKTTPLLTATTPTGTSITGALIANFTQPIYKCCNYDFADTPNDDVTSRLGALADAFNELNDGLIFGEIVQIAYKSPLDSVDLVVNEAAFFVILDELEQEDADNILSLFGDLIDSVHDYNTHAAIKWGNRNPIATAESTTDTATLLQELNDLNEFWGEVEGTTNTNLYAFNVNVTEQNNTITTINNLDDFRQKLNVYIPKGYVAAVDEASNISSIKALEGEEEIVELYWDRGTDPLSGGDLTS